MSSPRPACPGDGLLACADRMVGPIRLPEKNQNDFLAEFNQAYQKIGLCVGRNVAPFIIAPVTETIAEAPTNNCTAIPSTMPVRETLVDTLRACLDEAFADCIQRQFIVDFRWERGLYEQLSLTSAATASVVQGGSSIVGRVRQMAYAMESASRAMRGDRFTTNWQQSTLNSPVDSLQWDELQNHLRDMHRLFRDTLGALDMNRSECLTAAIQCVTRIAYYAASIRVGQ